MPDNDGEGANGTAASHLRGRVRELMAALRRDQLGADAAAVACLLGVESEDAERALRELLDPSRHELQLRGGTGKPGYVLDGRDSWSVLASLDRGRVEELRERRRDLETRRLVLRAPLERGPDGIEALLTAPPAATLDGVLEDIEGEAFRCVSQTIWHCWIENWRLHARPFGIEMLARPLRPEWSIQDVIDVVSGDEEALRRLDAVLLRKSFAHAREHPGTRYFINVFPHTLTDPESRDHLLRLLDGVNPNDVVLEISERFPIDVARFAPHTQLLHDRLASVAIDDWGLQGGDLEKLDGGGWTWHYVKTAQQHANISKRPIVRPVLEGLVRGTMASGRRVVVEGIEPTWLHDFLIWYAAGARLFQCYLLSRPSDEPRATADESPLMDPAILERTWNECGLEGTPKR